MISSVLKIAGLIHFFLIPLTCSFAPAVKIYGRNLKPVYQPHLLCALPVPDDKGVSLDGKFRNDDYSENTSTTSAKPRLASAIETIMQCVSNVLLSQCSSLKVNMNAVSNRAIMKGNIGNLSISARDCISRFKLLSFRKLDLYGVDLHLGYLPFILPIMPFFLWRFRKYIQSTIITVFLLKITGCLDRDNFRSRLESMKERIHHYIGSPRSPCISYSLAIASSDISNSLLLRFWLRSILQSLVQNSVIGAAAAIGDAAQKGMEAERRRMRNGIPLLPGSSAEVLPNLSTEDQQQQQGLTSALLSATSFELTNAGFMDERVVFDAKAVLPRDENGVANSLQFCIRAKLAPTTIVETDGQPIRQQTTQEVHNAVGFLQPECRLATKPLNARFGGNPLLQNLVSNLTPEYLWLPFGIGVAVPFGRRNEVYRASVDACEEGGYICRIDGAVRIMKEKETYKNKLKLK